MFAILLLQIQKITTTTLTGRAWIIMISTTSFLIVVECDMGSYMQINYGLFLTLNRVR